jgi:hypothetical protein
MGSDGPADGSKVPTGPIFSRYNLANNPKKGTGGRGGTSGWSKRNGVSPLQSGNYKFSGLFGKERKLVKYVNARATPLDTPKVATWEGELEFVCEGLVEDEKKRVGVGIRVGELEFLLQSIGEGKLGGEFDENGVQFDFEIYVDLQAPRKDQQPRLTLSMFHRQKLEGEAVSVERTMFRADFKLGTDENYVRYAPGKVAFLAHG